MYRFVEMGRWICAWGRRPVVWLALLTWGVLTVLVYCAEPIVPAHRFDLAEAHRVLENAGTRDPTKRKKRLVPRVVGVAPNGRTICTVTQGDDPWHYGAPMRIWDVQKQMLVTERAPPNFQLDKYLLRLSPSVIHGDWLAVRYSIPPKEKQDRRNTRYETEFIHIPTGTVGPTLDDHSFGVCPNNRWVADGPWDIRVLDLETQTRRVLRSYHCPNNDGVGTAQHPAESHCFSDDGRLLAVTDRRFVFVLDVDKDTRLAKLSFRAKDELRNWAEKITFSPDNEAIAWETGGDTVVTDFQEQHAIVIPRAELIGWHPQGHILVGRTNSAGKPENYFVRHPILRLESWDWREHTCVANWEVASLEESFPSQRPVPARMNDDTGWVTRSPCGRQVMFARFVEIREPPAFMAKLRAWLSLPEAPTHFIEVHLLDGSSLSLQTSWKIPVEESWYDREFYSFQFTADGRHLFFTDSHVVELWPIPPRSWLKSMLWAWGMTLALVGFVSIWRFWRKRKPDTMSAIPPPTNH